MNLVQAFDTLISFCAEYGIKPIAVNAHLELSQPVASVLVKGKGSEANAISEELFWETLGNDITVARVIFDGLEITVQIYEETAE